MSLENVVEVLRAVFSHLHPIWLIVSVGCLGWGILEVVCFGAFAPLYYRWAIPARRSTFQVEGTLEEVKKLIQEIFKKHGVAFKENRKVLLFRYPDILIIQPFVAFGFLELLAIESGRRVEVKIVGKSHSAALVCTALLAVGMMVDTTFRNQFMSGIESVILLFAIGFPLLWLPSTRWQRLTLNKMVSIVRKSFEGH